MSAEPPSLKIVPVPLFFLSHIFSNKVGTHSVIDTKNEFRSVIFSEFVILARPESESESESTPWVRVGVGVTQKPIDSAALRMSVKNDDETASNIFLCQVKGQVTRDRGKNGKGLNFAVFNIFLQSGT